MFQLWSNHDGTANNSAKKSRLSDVLLRFGGAAQRLRKSAIEIDGITGLLRKILGRQETYLASFGEAFRELAASADEVSATCGKMKDQADLVVHKARSSTTQITRLVGVAKSLNESKEMLANVRKAMDEMGKSVQLINDITFRTQMLSFNASIEAAKAGVHGKGFAVVAEEVRRLSDSTKSAADQIQVKMEAGKKSIVELVQTLDQRIGEVSEISDDTSKAFEVINTEIMTLESAVSQVTVGSSEQTSALGQSLNTLEQFLSVSAHNREILLELQDIQVELGTNSEKGVSALKDSALLPKVDASVVKCFVAAQILEAVTKRINSTHDLIGMIREVIASVCTLTEWSVAHVLIPDDKEIIRSTRILQIDPVFRNSSFAKKCEAGAFESGIGLPGDVYKAKTFKWIPDVKVDTNFPRADAAKELRLVSGMGIPIITRKGDVLAVIEFFAFKTLKPDESLVLVLEQLGQVIGQVVFIERMLNQFNIAESSRKAA